MALEIANDPNYRYDNSYRLALWRRSHLPVDVRTALAGNRETPTEVLLDLAQDTEATVRIATGSNLSLPEDARLGLLGDTDRQVRKQVIVNGTFSEDVLLAWDSEADSRQGLVERLEAPVWIWGDKRAVDSGHVLRRLATSPHAITRAAIAINSYTPLDVLERLANDKHPSVKDAVTRALSFDTANDYFYGGYDHAYIWWYRRELDVEEISSLARSTAPLLRAAVATRVVIRVDDLRVLVQDPDPSVRASVAGNPSTNFDDLVALAQDPAEQVQQRAISTIQSQLRERQQPPAKKENWLELEDDLPRAIPQLYGVSGRGLDARRVRIGMPWRREASWPHETALERLARVDNEAVKASVASYSGSYRSRTSDSPSATAFDLQLSPETLLLLIRDPSDAVRKAALSNTGATAARVASSAEVPMDALIGYARSGDVTVRRSVACNAVAPALVLANLTRDREATVRAAVANNPATPAEALSALAGDTTEDVTLALLSNVNTPPAILERQADRPSEFGEHERHRRLARNPSTPAPVLSKVAYSPWDDIRESVAGNPNTPLETLEILSFDENPRVRQASERHLSTPPDGVG